VAAAIRSRQAAASSSAAGGGAGKVSLTEVRLQLQRQLKQQVRICWGDIATSCHRGFSRGHRGHQGFLAAATMVVIESWCARAVVLAFQQELLKHMIDPESLCCLL
jgi:hypothetical protein